MDQIIKGVIELAEYLASLPELQREKVIEQMRARHVGAVDAQAEFDAARKAKAAETRAEIDRLKAEHAEELERLRKRVAELEAAKVPGGSSER